MAARRSKAPAKKESSSKKMGRPRLYESAEEFAKKADEYFVDVESRGKAPSIIGMSLFMGFSDKQGFQHYETYGDEFSVTVKKARSRIEQDRTERLMDKNAFTPGVIFDLKANYGWKDTQHQEINLNAKIETIERRVVEARN